MRTRLGWVIISKKYTQSRWLKNMYSFQRRHLSSKVSTDYYKILDIDPSASDKEVKAGFYKQSKLLHPDTHPEDENAPEKFRDLVAAYEVLSDPKKRKAYDDALRRPQQNFQWTPRGQNQGERPMQYGVDPNIMRNIEVDLSEERMKNAWRAYKERWKREEESIRKLEEKKLLFRLKLDERREAYATMTEDEKENIKENMRLFRHPDFMAKPLHTANKAEDRNPYENIFDEMKKPSNPPPSHRLYEDSEEMKRLIKERMKKDPSYKAQMEFWENMTSQARNNQSHFESRHGNAKSTTGQFFEEFANRSEELRRHWQERVDTEGANPKDANEAQNGKQQLGLAWFCAFFLLLTFGSGWYMNKNNDANEHNVYLKKLNEVKREQSS